MDIEVNSPIHRITPQKKKKKKKKKTQKNKMAVKALQSVKSSWLQVVHHCFSSVHVDF